MKREFNVVTKADRAKITLRDSDQADFKQNWRKLNTGRLLYEGFELYNAALLRSLASTDFSHLRNTHLNLLRHIDAEGTRMTDLANRSNLTKAAITSLVQACKDLGLVTVGRSSDDARARLVRFSPKGLALMAHIQTTILAIEDRILVLLKDEEYGNLRTALLSLSRLRNDLAP